MRTLKLVVAGISLVLAGATGPAAQPRGPAPRPKPAAPEPGPRAGGPAAPARPGAGSSSPIVIDADRMEALRKEGLVIFSGNVVARQDNSVQTADRMEVYLDDKGERVLRIISTGNVKIVTEDCRTGTARRAEYYDDEQRLVLIGDAKVWQDENVVTGERITIYLAEDRSTVEGGTRDRVKSVFYPRREEGGGAVSPAPRREARGPAACG